MSISAVQSHDNNIKRNVIFTTSGAALGAGIGMLNVREDLLLQKNNFKNFIIGFNLGDSKNELDKITRNHEIGKMKNFYKTAIKDIKKRAPFNIALKIALGGVIGFCTGILVSYFMKNKNNL